MKIDYYSSFCPTNESASDITTLFVPQVDRNLVKLLLK